MKIIIKIKTHPGTSQWLGLHFPNARGAGWIPGRGARIPHASQPKYQNIIQFSSVTQSCPPNELQHTRPPCPSPTPGVPPNPCPSSQWCYATISSSLVPFSSCPTTDRFCLAWWDCSVTGPVHSAGCLRSCRYFHYEILLRPDHALGAVQNKRTWFSCQGN